MYVQANSMSEDTVKEAILKKTTAWTRFYDVDANSGYQVLWYVTEISSLTLDCQGSMGNIWRSLIGPPARLYWWTKVKIGQEGTLCAFLGSFSQGPKHLVVWKFIFKWQCDEKLYSDWAEDGQSAWEWWWGIFTWFGQGYDMIYHICTGTKSCVQHVCEAHIKSSEGMGHIIYNTVCSAKIKSIWIF